MTCFQNRHVFFLSDQLVVRSYQVLQVDHQAAWHLQSSSTTMKLYDDAIEKKIHLKKHREDERGGFCYMHHAHNTIWRSNLKIWNLPQTLDYRSEQRKVWLMFFQQQCLVQRWSHVFLGQPCFWSWKEKHFHWGSSLKEPIFILWCV